MSNWWAIQLYSRGDKDWNQKFKYAFILTSFKKNDIPFYTVHMYIMNLLRVSGCNHHIEKARLSCNGARTFVRSCCLLTPRPSCFAGGLHACSVQEGAYTIPSTYIFLLFSLILQLIFLVPEREKMGNVEQKSTKASPNGIKTMLK